jgi:DNA-binding CsgD family transcriptional regulator
MPRLSKDHAQALTELRGVAGRPLPPDGMGGALIGALERAIGWDGYRLFGVDPRTLLINRLLSASDNDHRARREWLEEVYLDDRTLPYLQLPTIIRARLRGVAFQPTQDQSWGYPRAMLSGIEPDHHWTYYYESESPIGGTLHGAFEAHGRQIAVLQAYRRDPNAHFRPKDVALMQTAAPIVGEALGTALDRERALTERNPSAPSGIVLIGPDRTIEFSTPAGDAWLERLRASERDEVRSLPAAVWSVVKGLAMQDQPALRVATMTLEGPVVLEASAGGNGTTAIVVTPQRPEPRLEPPTHWGLTPQQNQIAMQVIGGASNREIAGALFVSENTVEWHLRQIYRALDLSSRTQLQARFFRDVGLEVYQDSGAE